MNTEGQAEALVLYHIFPTLVKLVYLVGWVFISDHTHVCPADHVALCLSYYVKLMTCCGKVTISQTCLQIVTFVSRSYQTLWWFKLLTSPEKKINSTLWLVHVVIYSFTLWLCYIYNAFNVSKHTDDIVRYLMKLQRKWSKEIDLSLSFLVTFT